MSGGTVVGGKILDKRDEKSESSGSIRGLFSCWEGVKPK
jgi:hypothetical protein